MSAYDPCVYINDSTGIVLQLHVDNITIFGKHLQAILEFKGKLSEAVRIIDEEECSWYLGMHVEQNPSEVHNNQKQYVDQILAKYGFDSKHRLRLPYPASSQSRKIASLTLNSVTSTNQR